MSNKINIVIVVLAGFLLIFNIGQFIFWHGSVNDMTEKYTKDIAAKDLLLEGIGEEVTIYSVSEAKKPGDEIKAEDLVEMTGYKSSVTDQFITDTSTIIGKLYKIGINPGTPILTNMVMDEELDATSRIHDIVLDSLTVGADVGDYIDIRIRMPYGDDYIVLSHKRIYAINNETIQVYFTELEWNTYLGALVDYFLNADYGCTIYGTKYIEPGLQPDAVAYYAVPTNIAALLQKNPNIVDKEEAASLNEWRASMEDILVIFRTDEDTVESDAGRLNNQVVQYNESVEADRVSEKQAREEAAEEAAEAAEDGEETGDDFWEESPSDDSEATMTEEGE